MTRLQVFLVLTLLMVIGLSLGLALIVLEDVDPHLAFAVMLPVVMASVFIWLQHSIFPRKELRDINTVAKRIEQHMEKEWLPFEIEEIPVEIRPLIKAINTLLHYHNDRHMQERDFTAHASHELRTPLAGIRLQTELAMSTDDPQKREQALRNVVKAIDRATRMVEQLLTISRLTADKFDLAIEDVDLVSLARNAVDERQDMADNKKIMLVLKTDCSNLIVKGSEESLMILLDNLLRNALLHTPDNGSVIVAVAKENDEAILSVTDTGPGIPENMRAMVMERFQKADTGIKTGTGLGLAIVSRVAKLHHGRIALGSGANEHGLCAKLILPSA